MRSILGKKNGVAWNLTAIGALTQMSPTRCAGGYTSVRDTTSPVFFADEAHPEERPAAFISQPPSGRPLLERCCMVAPLLFSEHASVNSMILA
jgi:hypothetical protein